MVGARNADTTSRHQSVLIQHSRARIGRSHARLTHPPAIFGHTRLVCLRRASVCWLADGQMSGLSADCGLCLLSASLAWAWVECLQLLKLQTGTFLRCNCFLKRTCVLFYFRESAHHPPCRHGILFSSICSLVSCVHWTKEGYVRLRVMHVNHLVQVQTQRCESCKDWQAQRA